MRTRRASYASPSDHGVTFAIKPKLLRPKSTSSPMDSLQDELLVSIMVALSSSVSRPSDLVNAMLSCKRLCAAGSHQLVLAHASPSALAVKARNWSEGSSTFLRLCARSGNVEAAYTLGMINFYCFRQRELGATLMAQAAMKGHPAALLSLAIIRFNGTGGTKKDKNPKKAASLCARAAAQGHVQAIRELGHCLQDGYGMPKNRTEGLKLLLRANALEAVAANAVALPAQAVVEAAVASHKHLQCGKVCDCIDQLSPDRLVIDKLEAMARVYQVPVFCLLHGGSPYGSYGSNEPPKVTHIANQFLVEWFRENPPSGGLRLCSNANCGRPETRQHEFRCCSACSKANYCSRSCQSMDWKVRHKHECEEYTRIRAR